MKLYKLFLTALIMLIPIGAFAADDVYKTMDLGASYYTAREIMYKYLLDYSKGYPSLHKEIKQIGANSIVAFEIDLNDDGVNEIIGYHDSFLFKGTMGKDLTEALFIIQKTKKGYKDISNHLFYSDGACDTSLYVLNEKTDGYRNLLLVKKEADNKKGYKKKIEYINGKYEFAIK